LSPTAELKASGDVPQAGTLAFARAINQGDLSGATNCFALDACLITPDSTAIRGREEIRPIIAQLIARQTQIEVLSSSVLAAGEVALGSERWRISAAGPEGDLFAQESRPMVVARRLEGGWKLAIAALWGWGGTPE
jgi:ketosteroid isomerase-like protein